MFKNISELNNIELIELNDPILNDKKRKLKKIILCIVAVILYIITLIMPTYKIVDFFKNKNINYTYN